MVRAHHQQAIDRIREHFINDPRFPALIGCGSVFNDRARDDSDIDLYFITADGEWAKRKAKRDYFFYTEEFTDYPGGYTDGEYLTLQFLRDVADHGTEPWRFAFKGAHILYSHIPDLEDILRRIPVYPEHEQQQKIEAFYSQVIFQGYFFYEAEKRNDMYLLTKSAGDLVFFGARLLLAYNKILFPTQKWLMTELAKAPEKPENFFALANEVLTKPNSTAANAFVECLTSFRDWGIASREVPNFFIEYTEWNWRNGKPPVYDW